MTLEKVFFARMNKRNNVNNCSWGMNDRHCSIVSGCVIITIIVVVFVVVTITFIT